MSKEIRQMIDKVKNIKQFANTWGRPLRRRMEIFGAGIKILLKLLFIIKYEYEKNL